MIDARKYLAGLDNLFDEAAATAPGMDRALTGLASFSKTLRPNRRMNPADWGESKLYLDAKASPGMDGDVRFRFWQRRWLEAMFSGAKSVAIKTCPRAGKSLALAAALLYNGAHEGYPGIYWERTEHFLQVFHNEKVWPLLNSPKLKGILVKDDPNAPKDLWTDRWLSNGAGLHHRSASTPDGTRQIPGRLLICDEISAPQYKDGQGGNVSDTVDSRGRQFVDTVVVKASTPADDDCAITKAFLEGDQRVIHVPCKHCGVYQALEKVVGPVAADGTPQKPGPGLRYTVDPDTRRVVDVWYQCKEADCPGAEGANEPGRIRETWKAWMLDVERAEYVAMNPNAKPGYISFDLWSIHVSDPQVTWMDIAAAHLECVGDPSKRRTFHTDWLAEKWEVGNVAVIGVEALEQRAEHYEAEVPDGVRVITFGEDVQEGEDASPTEGGKPPRREIMLCGWGYGEECWVLGRWVLQDDVPFTDAANKAWFDLFVRRWNKADGTQMVTLCGIPDVNHMMVQALTFWGSNAVQKLSRETGTQFWPAVGGNYSPAATAPLISLKQKATNVATGREYYRLNKNKGVEPLYTRLRMEGQGPQVIHWPTSLAGTGFVKSLTAFKRLKDPDTGAIWFEDKRGNEMMDCWVYAYAALQRAKDEWPEVMRAITMEEPPPRPLQKLVMDRSANSSRGDLERRLIAPRRAVGVAPLRPPEPPPGHGRATAVNPAQPVNITVRSPRVIRSSVMG